MSFHIAMDWQTGFLPNAKQTKPFGYITAFQGFKLAAPGLASDLTVFTPFNSATAPEYKSVTLTPSTESTYPSVKVAGVIESFFWEGGAGDPIEFSFYVSQTNANTIKEKLNKTLESTDMNALGWWIGDYDQETGQWYERAFPKNPEKMTGKINGGQNPVLSVDPNGVKVASGINVLVYRVHVQVVPAANQLLHMTFANSAKLKKQTFGWGLIVSNTSSQNLPPGT